MRSALRMGFAVFIMASPSAFAAGAKAPLQVVVSREQQSLVVYDGDTVVATSRVSTGKAGHATPTGIFSILEKRRRHEFEHLFQCTDAVHAATDLVGHRTAWLEPCAGLSRFAWLREAAEQIRSPSVQDDEPRHACDRIGSTGRAGRGCGRNALSAEQAAAARASPVGHPPAAGNRGVSTGAQSKSR